MTDDFPDIELEYVIRNAKVNIAFEDGFFGEDEQEEVKKTVDLLAEEMCIDRSYVDSKTNRRPSTFIVEDGWVSLKNLVLSTHFCQLLHPSHHHIFVDAIATMSLCYIYECLSTMGYDVDHIILTMRETQTLEMFICKDESSDWKSYQGRWQDWDVGEDGKFCSKQSKVNKKTRKQEDDKR